MNIQSMKMRFKFIAVLLIAFVTFSACQQEESSTLEDVSDGNTPIPDSAIRLFTQISTNDGSHDNIVDRASCVELVLPITVTINNRLVTIEDTDDFQTIEFLSEEHEDDDDEIVITFPIEVILKDHTVVNIPNQEALDVYVTSCLGENEEDEDIESIDVRYPLTFPIYNTETTNTSIQRVLSDAEMHGMMSSLMDSDVISVVFPVSFELSDGSIISTTDYESLENTIIVSENGFDEDDDYDFNDDDTVILSETEFVNVLVQCGWEIDNLVKNDEDLTSNYNGYHFEFYDFADNRLVTGCIGSELRVGTWDVTTVNNNLRLSINFEELTDVNNNWIVHTFETDGSISFDLRLGEEILDFKIECFDQTPDIIALLTTGDWSVYYYSENGQDMTSQFNYFEFGFNSVIDSVQATNTLTSEMTLGSWEVTNFGLELGLDFGPVSDPLNNMNNDAWDIYYYDDNTLDVQSGSTILVLEKM